VSKDRSTSGGTVTGAGGFQTGRGASANRLPTAPRERKPALAALAVLLILAGALSTMLLVTRSGNRVDVVMMKNTVQVGQKIGAGDLTDVSVAADNGIAYVKWDQANQLVGRTTYNPLVAGSILIPAMLGAPTNSSAPAGTTVVGVMVKAGHYPPGYLSSGVTVTVLGVDNTVVAATGGTNGANTGTAGGSAHELGNAKVLQYATGETVSVTLETATPELAEKIALAGDTITLIRTIG
jgi:hypothetical protein